LKVRERTVLYCAPFEDVDLEDTQFDIALTSPPYYDTENYSDEETQSFRRWTSFEKWVRGFLHPLLVNTLAHLKPGSPFIINVGNCKYDLTDSIKKLLQRDELKDVKIQHLYDYRIGRPLEGGGESIEDFLVLRKSVQQ
jgi:site-specific DNA-adenine methylase